jgi:N-acetylneuraminic acid mutarotase
MYKGLNLLIILILLVNKVIYGQNFTPGPREEQTAVLVEDKIYYIGGIELAPFSNSNFFYLEIDKAWVDLTSFPLNRYYAAGIGGVNQDLIFIIGSGGGGLEEQNVLQFDTKTNTLTASIIKGKIPRNRSFINTVSYKGKIYVFGGLDNGIIYNGFDILNTIDLSWDVGSLEGALASFGYAAILVDEIIYYIGGLQQAKGRDFVPMENVCKLTFMLIN